MGTSNASINLHKRQTNKPRPVKNQMTLKTSETEKAWSSLLFTAAWPSTEFARESIYSIVEAQSLAKDVDERKWLEFVLRESVRRVVPIVLRSAAEVSASAQHLYGIRYEEIREAAKACESESVDPKTALESALAIGSGQDFESDKGDDELQKALDYLDNAVSVVHELYDALSGTDGNLAKAADQAAVVITRNALRVGDHVRTAVLTEAVNITLEAYRSA